MAVAYDWYVAISQFFSNPLVTLLAGFVLSIIAGRLSNVWQETARTGSKTKNVRRLFRQAAQIVKYRDILARNIGGIQMTVFSERVIVSSIFVALSALSTVFVIIRHKYIENTGIEYEVEFAISFCSYVLFGVIFIRSLLQRLMFYSFVMDQDGFIKRFCDDVDKGAGNIEADMLEDLKQLAQSETNTKDILKRHPLLSSK